MRRVVNDPRIYADGVPHLPTRWRVDETRRYLEVVARVERGERLVDIARSMGVGASVVRTLYGRGVYKRDFLRRNRIGYVVDCLRALA